MRRKPNKKKKIIIVLVFLLIIILTIFIFKDRIKESFTYKDKITIEAGSTIPSPTDYLNKKIKEKVTLEWENLETTDGKVYTPGTYKGKLNIKEESKEVILIVQDKTPPVITGTKDIEILAFTETPDLLEGITATDNTGEEIEVTTKGEYDLETPGTYPITYIAKDTSGNIATTDITVTIKENENVKISKTSKGNKIKNYYGITYIDDVIIANKSYSLPSNFAPNNLVTINGYIRVVDYVKTAFTNLSSDASSLGLTIYASSGYRSYKDQDYIYNNYVKKDGKEKADTYSSRAGYSDHQTGLTIDVNTIDMTFDNTDESNWLSSNCYKYGFIIRYPKGKEEYTGYMYEPWHIRYVGKNLAQILYNDGSWLSLEEYFGIDSKYKD